MHPLLRLTVLAQLLCVPTSLAHALQTTWHVDASAPAPGAGTPAEPYSSIQYAISRATTVDGDTVLVAPGEYVENVDNLFKALTIESAQGPSVTTIRGAALGPVVLLIGTSPTVIPNVTLSGFTVTGLIDAPGAPWYSAAVLACCSRVRECIVRDNAVIVTPLNWDRGIGIYASSGDVHIERCTVIGNTSGVRENIYGAAFVESSIVWGNLLTFNPGSLWSVQHSIIDGQSPLLWDVARRDFHLAPGSPCIDAGSPALPLDPDGSIADIGALTYDPGYAPAPVSYCTGKLNGQGCVPEISASGTCSATNGQPFFVTATLVSSHKFGRLFYGFAQAAIPFVGGIRCIAAPTARTSLFDSGGTSQPCSGVLSYDFNARIQSGVDPALFAGRMVYAQFWYRDPSDPAGFGVGLTNATSFGIAP